jgi:hypothetical protein
VSTTKGQFEAVCRNMGPSRKLFLAFVIPTTEYY